MPLKLTMVTFSVLLMFLVLMFYFLNTFYYVSCLLVFMVLLLLQLVFLHSFSSLFSIMLALIYIGAMMIFIGYVCAISPNPLFVSNMSYVLGVCIFILGSFLYSGFMPVSAGSSFYFISDFFYSFDGVYAFLLIIFMLFYILLVVSAQYFLPKGPFRSS